MVARAAGVSPSTVSRIMNGTARVSEPKRLAVNAAIERLGFKPNPIARSLASGNTMSVGVLTQSIDSPFYGEALRGVEDALLRYNYVPIFISGHWQQEHERERLEMLQERKVDGIIVITGSLTDETLLQLAQRLPVVVTGRKLSGANLFSIDFDNVSGMYLAVRHLLDLGHRRIAYISGPLNNPDAAARLEGYRQGLAHAGISPDPELIIMSDFLETGGQKSMQALLDSRAQFSAVIAANDQMAYGARLILHRAGLRVPEDISLVGFDDLFHSAYTLPPLTSVRLSAYVIGKAAAEAMVGLLRGARPLPQSTAAKLVVRESTKPYTIA